MTIDLGFAHLRLPGGTEIGIVDVPGHQDLVRNMLAGVGSIDAVVLVVAADEGVMPQTLEHLAILELLGVGTGVIALSKRDLVDDELASLVSDDVRAAVRRTPLRDAPLIPVSATTGVGLEELVAAIERVLAAKPRRRDLGRPRLPIDRAFTMTGHGTVVTGTLIDGALEVGDEVEIVPGGRRVRVRALQTHRRAVDMAAPGSRVAANIVGIEKSDLERGMTLVRPGSLAATSLLGLRLAVLEGASGPLLHDDQVKVHVGTAEVMARVAVLEGDEIGPGAEGWAQLRLAAPVAAAGGDRLVIRRPSPPETIGGGVVVDTTGARSKRRSETAETLARRSAPSAAARMLAVLDVPRSAREAGERAGVNVEERAQAVRELVESGRAVALGDALIDRDAFEGLATRALRTLAMGHRRSPLRQGVPREEVRGALGLDARLGAVLLARLASEGRLEERGPLLALPLHRPALAPEQESAWQRARAALERAPLQPPSVNSLDTDYGLTKELLAALADREDIVRVGDSAFLPSAVRSFAEAVVAELAAAGRITVARARDLTGSSRKHVLPLLQFLDDSGITRRIGDDRVLVLGAEEARARASRLGGGGGAES